MTTQGRAPSTVGERIGDARRRKGVAMGRDLLVPEMAEEVGVTPQTAYHWEAGTKVPREEALTRLATYLGVTPAYLRYGIPLDAPMVEPDPALDRKVTESERQSAAKLVARQPTRKPDGRRGAGGG